MPRLTLPAILSMLALVVQNAAVALITRQTRLATNNHRSDPNAVKPYHSSSVILLQEVVKMLFCLIFFAYEKRSGSLASYWSSLHSIVSQPDAWKLAVPAALFTFQNFLIFISLANLDVVSYQMLSQTKLLSAAVFTELIMKRRLSRMQWIALLILTLGVILAQVDLRGFVIAKHLPESIRHLAPATLSPSTTSAATTTSGAVLGNSNNSSGRSSSDQVSVVDFSMLGVVTCLLSGLSSSFAGVYFEKVVKTSAPSLAVRNIHLSLFAIPFAIVSMLILDVFREGLSTFEVLRGFTPMVWALVMTHAIGGLLVAAVVKYADNIMKGFATAIATVLSGIYAASAFCGGCVGSASSPTVEFIVGCVAVFSSVIMFHCYDPPRQVDVIRDPSETKALIRNEDAP